MGLFEEIGEMTGRQVTKSELGENRIYGTVAGIVTNNYSSDYPGRVCVQIPRRDKDANVLKWARLATPYIGKKHGMYFMPEVGDQVLLVFEDGNIEKPFIIGCIPTDSSSFVSKVSDEDNQKKSIVSANGNEITIFDNKEGEGEKDRIEIKTAKDSLKVSLDNEKNSITLSDKDGKNSVVMNVEKGEMSIKLEKKLKIKVGDLEVVMNGESGKMSVTCDKYKLTGKDNIKIETNGIHKISAENAMVNANSAFKAEGGNSVVISGQLIKIG